MTTNDTEAKESPAGGVPPLALPSTDTDEIERLAKEFAESKNMKPIGSILPTVNMPNGYGLAALAANAVIACICMAVTLIIATLALESDTIGFSHGWSVKIGLLCGSIAAWGYIHWIWGPNSLWVEAKPLEGVLCQDLLFKEFVVYVNGFFFIYPWHKLLDRKIEFTIKDELRVSQDDADILSFQCKSGWNVKFLWDGMIQIGDTADEICHFLTLDTDIVKEWIAFVINARLGDIAALNTYEALMSNKRKIAEYAALILYGDNILSPLEQTLGIRVKNIQLSDVEITDEDVRKAFAGKGKAKVIGDIARDIDEGKRSQKALEMAGVIDGLIPMTISELRVTGMPPGSTLIVGDATSGALVAGKKGDKAKEGGKK